MRALASALLFLMGFTSGCNSASCPVGSVNDGGVCAVSEGECGCVSGERCVLTGAAVECVCAPGYAGDPCVWSGAPVDPGFETENTWARLNGASVLPGAQGRAGNLGLALFDPTAACEAARVSQMFEMPALDETDPLMAELVYRSNGVVDVGFGRAYHQLPASSVPTPTIEIDAEGWATGRFCLGEAAYGVEVEFQVAPSERNSACFDQPQSEIEVDVFRVTSLEPDEECPRPGEVLNGAAEVGDGGWFFEIDGDATAGEADAAFAAGVGVDGSGAARLFEEANIANDAIMLLPVSVPLSGPDMHPALSFSWKATEGSEFNSFLRSPIVDRKLELLFGTGEWEEHTYCLPAWSYGVVVDLFFELGASNGVDAELLVDDVRLHSVEACGDSIDILDPSFESTETRWPGTRRSATGRVGPVQDPDEALTGTGVLEIAYANNRERQLFEHWLFVPEGDADEGPELVFHWKVPEVPEMTIRWFLEEAREIKGDMAPGLDGDWVERGVCLPADWSGRWMRFLVVVGETFDDPVARQFDEPKRVLLDDFIVRTSPRCSPAQ